MKTVNYILVIFFVMLILSGCQKPVEIDWYTDASEYIDQVGEKIKFKLPANEDGFSGAVWGTNIYTYDSSIGAAAVHAGAITLEEGGEVTIEMLKGAESYKGSVRNGITTSDWGPYDYSFKIIK
jgi:hypothetical protein